MKANKQKKCGHCKKWFVAHNSLVKVCSPNCAWLYVQAEKQKKEDKAHRENKKAVKPRSKWMKEAQAAFNAYIRERDHYDTCICCGAETNDKDLLTGSRWDAGHYLSTGARPNLRFNEDNCHKQSVRCNRHLSGNAAEYRIQLIKKIGQARVDTLESDYSTKKYTIEDFERVKTYYSKLARAMKKCREMDGSELLQG